MFAGVGGRMKQDAFYRITPAAPTLPGHTHKDKPSTATIAINSNTRRHIARTLSGRLCANLRDDIELRSSSHRRVPSGNRSQPSSRRRHSACTHGRSVLPTGSASSSPLTHVSSTAAAVAAAAAALCSDLHQELHICAESKGSTIHLNYIKARNMMSQ